MCPSGMLFSCRPLPKRGQNCDYLRPPQSLNDSKRDREPMHQQTPNSNNKATNHQLAPRHSLSPEMLQKSIALARYRSLIRCIRARMMEVIVLRTLKRLTRPRSSRKMPHVIEHSKHILMNLPLYFGGSVMFSRVRQNTEEP